MVVINDPPWKKERRHGPDVLLRISNALSVSSWFVMVLILLAIERARPRVETLYDRRFNVTVPGFWDRESLGVLLALSLLGAVMSGAGLWANSKRLRRKDDRYRVPLVLLALVSVTGLVIVRLR